MQQPQLLLLALLIVSNVALFFKSKTECARSNSFGLTRGLSVLGMFVWGDVLVLSSFWVLVAGVSLMLQSWWLFLLLVSTFWLVRSLGETVYWFLQQFASQKRDKPDTLLGYNLVKNESIWFMYQVFWQCMTVVSVVTTIYCASQWLESLPA